MKKIVTREAVAAAIQQITERGNKPTIERIRAITGGSPKTISIIKNAIENGNNGILDGTDDHDTLPLFDRNGNVTTSLSYHNITHKIDSMIVKRVDHIVMQRLDMVLSRLEGTPQNQNDHDPNDPNDPNETEAKATSLKLENEGLVEALGEMRALWLEAVDQLLEAQEEVTALTKDFAQLESRFKPAQKERLTTGTRIAEGEERFHNDKGERVFKSELALAVRHLVMTVGMSQKEVGELLGLSSNEVSQLKNRGTKLHQQRAKS